MITRGALVATALLGLAAGAEAKPLDVTYELVILPHVETVTTFDAGKKDGSDIVLRQTAYPASSIRLNAPVTVDTASAGPIPITPAMMFISARTSAGRMYCRTFLQWEKGDHQYDHAAICLRDSDNDGAIEQALYGADETAMTVFDIKYVEAPVAFPRTQYTMLPVEQGPRTDVVVRADVSYGAAMFGAAPKPLAVSFISSLSMPDEFLTENWGARHWPFVDFKAGPAPRLPPRSGKAELNKPESATLGPYKIAPTAQGSTLTLAFEGAAAPGAWAISGEHDIGDGATGARRRLLQAVREPTTGSPP